MSDNLAEAQTDAEQNFSQSPVGSPARSCPEAAKASDGTASHDNKIDVVFDPDKSEKVTKCDKIVHVQLMQYTVDGKAITGRGYSAANYSFKDASVTSDDGWTVDCLSGETTPDYQQGTGNGKKNGGSAKAKMSDAPQTAGGDKGFYNATTNPDGYRRVCFKFTTYAWCMQGPDCGKWYEGISWEYVKTWEDQRDGKIGTSTLTDANVTSAPSKGQLDAFDKFNKKHGFVPCS